MFNELVHLTYAIFTNALNITYIIHEKNNFMIWAVIRTASCEQPGAQLFERFIVYTPIVDGYLKVDSCRIPMILFQTIYDSIAINRIASDRKEYS